VDRCVVAPTARILELADETHVPVTLFVDATEFAAMERAGLSVVARVPVLASTTTTTSQMGIGFDRGGVTFSNGTPLSSVYNPNPLLGLVSGPGVSTMAPGYIASASRSRRRMVRCG